MVDKYINLLEYQENFFSKMDSIIESFVSFYGEDKREEITNKFQTCVVMPYISINDLKEIIKKIKKEKTIELCDELVNNSSIKKEQLKSFFPYSEFGDNLFLRYYNFVSKVKESKEEIKADTFLTKFDSNITAKNILDGNLDEKMKLMEEVRPLITRLNESYNEVINRIDKYDKMTNIKTNEIGYKHMYMFAVENKELLGDEFTKIEEEYKDYGVISLYRYPKFNMYFGHINDSGIKISCFDEKSEKSIKDDDFFASLIKNDRISFYKNMGIDLGKDYEAYEKSEKCRSIRPTKEIIEYYLKQKEHYNKEYKKEVLENYPIYRQCKSVLDKENFLDRVDLDVLFDEGITAVLPNFVKKENEIVNCPIVLLNLGRDIEGLDQNIIHEFNHLYELTTIDVNEKGYNMVCGWDILNHEFDEEDTKVSRKYEKMNEIVNDLLAEQVCKIMHSKGEYLFSSSDKVRYNMAGYRRTTFLVSGMLKNFYDEVLESRKGNMDIIFDKLGKENIDSLNGLFPIYEEKFGGFKVLNLIDDINNGRTTELTEFKKGIDTKRDLIIENMKKYLLEHKKKTI